MEDLGVGLPIARAGACLEVHVPTTTDADGHAHEPRHLKHFYMNGRRLSNREGGRFATVGLSKEGLVDRFATVGLGKQGLGIGLRKRAAGRDLEIGLAEEVGLMNRDEIDGKVDQVKGKVKQAAGDLADDQRLHDEGVADEAAGTVQEGFGKARRKVGDALHDVAHKIKD